MYSGKHGDWISEKPARATCHFHSLQHRRGGGLTTSFPVWRCSGVLQTNTPKVPPHPPEHRYFITATSSEFRVVRHVQRRSRFAMGSVGDWKRQTTPRLLYPYGVLSVVVCVPVDLYRSLITEYTDIDIWSRYRISIPN